MTRFQLISALGINYRLGKSTPATAIAAMPSSRPANPSFSFVVALTPILFSGIPSAAAMFFFIAAMCGKIFGAWAMTVASTFTIFPPFLATCAAASCKKTLLGAFFQRGVCVGEKMADVRFAQRAQDGIADGVHQGIGVRMAVQALRVRDINAAQNQFASRDQRMDVIANANVNHAKAYP